MGGTGANRTSANTYSLFTGTAAANTNWLGVLSGLYNSGLSGQGSYGNWWSSTAGSGTSAYYLSLSSSLKVERRSTAKTAICDGVVYWT